MIGTRVQFVRGDLRFQNLSIRWKKKLDRRFGSPWVLLMFGLQSVGQIHDCHPVTTLVYFAGAKLAWIVHRAQILSDCRLDRPGAVTMYNHKWSDAAQ